MVWDKTEVVRMLLAGIKDASGNPIASGDVYFYEPGTKVEKAVFTSSNGTAVSQPVALSSYGTRDIWGSGRYDIEIQDSDGNVVTRIPNAHYNHMTPIVEESAFSTSNSTDEETLFSESFDGSYITEESVIEVFFAFDILNDSGDYRECTLRVKIGSSTIATHTVEGLVHSTGERLVGHLNTFIIGNKKNHCHTELRFSHDTSHSSTDMDEGGEGDVSHFRMCSDRHQEELSGETTIAITGELSVAHASFEVRHRHGYIKVR
jgi:hypothetical protein